MKKLIVANWKMNPRTSAEAGDIVAKIDEHVRGMESGTQRLDIVFCPPFVFLEDVAAMLSEGVLADVARLGAQDIAARDDLAQTGEVSGPQLAKLGVRYVIAGHSDRRYKLGETDEMVNTKVRAALRNALVPIVCVGERTREGDWKDALAVQVAATLQGLTPGQVSQCVIAYEPVWAISTNPDAKPDTPAGAVVSMGLIREALADHFDVSHHAFLYGGSVTPANAQDFLERPEIGGILVGGASVRAEDFCAILSVAARIP
jgi:triosephosphate isomerase